EDELKSLTELEDSVGESLASHDRIESDGSKQQPEASHHEPFGHGRSGQVADHHKSEDQESKILRRAELDRKRGQRWREEHQANDAERPGDERAEIRDLQRRAGSILSRHLIVILI